MTPIAYTLRGPALQRLNAGVTGSSRVIARAIVLAEPPSLDAGEITDKGSLNSRGIRERRETLVDRLYDDTDPDVIRPCVWPGFEFSSRSRHGCPTSRSKAALEIMKLLVSLIRSSHERMPSSCELQVEASTHRRARPRVLGTRPAR